MQQCYYHRQQPTITCRTETILVRRLVRHNRTSVINCKQLRGIIKKVLSSRSPQPPSSLSLSYRIAQYNLQLLLFFFRLCFCLTFYTSSARSSMSTLITLALQQLLLSRLQFFHFLPSAGPPTTYFTVHFYRLLFPLEISFKKKFFFCSFVRFISSSLLAKFP